MASVSLAQFTQTNCVGTSAADGSEFSADPFTWIGTGQTRAKLEGSSTAKLLISLNGLTNIGGKDAAYTGFAIWSRKKCGPDFMDKVNDGTVTFDMLDTYDSANPNGWYDTAGQFSYKRDDGSSTSVSIQWGQVVSFYFFTYYCTNLAT